MNPQIQHHPTHHYPLKSSPDQRENLARLADFLTAIHDCDMPTHFDMWNFFVDADETKRRPVRQEDYECGTIACAAGFGPAAGVPALPDESWDGYIKRAFGVGSVGVSHDAIFLFNAHWAMTDNTAEGAALRIRYALDYGVPNNTADQMLGRAYLCYRDPL